MKNSTMGRVGAPALVVVASLAFALPAPAAVRTTAPTPVTHHVVRAAPAHRSGLPLIVGAAVLLVLVGISLALMRRVARLHRDVTMGAAG